MSESRVIRAADRTHWRGEGLYTRQSMPFTGNFDLGANAHGQLLVHNDDLVDPGSGVDRHFHRDAEIVTWVVTGEIHHDDSSGSTGLVRAGQVQAMSAGTGVNHREQNPRATGTVARVIQMWLPPNEPGGEPEYRTADVALGGRGLVTVASGIAGHSPAVTIGNDAAALYGARLGAGEDVILPAAPFGHLFVVTGTIETDGERLTEGDALRSVDAGESRVRAAEPAEILFWEMHVQARSAIR
ncbi:pirin family protein [Tsukamurella paurometabola]|uniref:Pirin domain protein n=1 Tax=Tsukamurella paurometabola (strain ATCC 8368 / DSM 20162 / CCUG 35730 / CIP 100753 / JCM 10117 / KCTC 9821 / NBRC 16120 / NCIMB 702349 / NCTC 13040) TaxID=521096 RepID=D5UM85_TSUPD|nr:pirin family protein [Tsukamurella paurometabola]ADG78365.1 Pirin domain protein [Tsukamurella paurometabola DSM 20162]SUP31364.1 Quercetin 2,3-dioxygenase [Tsukamurella paurometabola]